MAQPPGSRMPAGGLIAYFGYGSLVNRATHRTPVVDAIPARLLGWRRQWRPRPDMPVFPAALLTVRREASSACDGLVVIDRAESLPEIDAREARYQRRSLDRAQLELRGKLAADIPLYVYEALEAAPEPAEPPSILRSYLDAVLQGFLREHGEEGVRRFIHETDGFEIGIREDRDDPIYPRWVELSKKERRLFDRLLVERAGTGQRP